jgi:hypothetical protein
MQKARLRAGLFVFPRPFPHIAVALRAARRVHALAFENAAPR